MDDFWEIAIPMLFLFGSIVLAIFLLARARRNARSELPEEANPVPATASKRQKRILAKLEPEPQLPTLKELVRQEIADLGLEDVPGAAGLAGPVMLKVYRRDHDETCTHDTHEFLVAEGVNPADAQDNDVHFRCPTCADQATAAASVATSESEAPVEKGTEQDG